MSISKLADKVLSVCIKEFIDEGKEMFASEQFLLHFLKEPNHKVYAAIRMLENNEFVSIFYADGEPYTFSINIEAIKDAEENTLIKKGYDLIKEIHQWL